MTHKYIPSKLKSWRHRYGLDVAEAAEATGRSKRTYGAYERGELTIPFEVAAMCAAWDCETALKALTNSDDPEAAGRKADAALIEFLKQLDLSRVIDAYGQVAINNEVKS